jgi:DNA adenine methylase
MFRQHSDKKRCILQMLRLVPEHLTYVESSSSLSLLFSKAPSPIEVVNDTDSHVVNLFGILRNTKELERFCRIVFRMQCTRLGRNRNRFSDRSDRVVKTAKWFTSASCCVIDTLAKSVPIRLNTDKQTKAPLFIPKGFRQIVSRLMLVQIERKSFRHIVRTFDRPEAFFFLEDPANGSADSNLPRISDEDLVYLLLQIKGKVIFLGEGNFVFIYLERAGWERHELTGCSHDQPRTIWVRR